MRYSIVVPAYNEAAYLPATLDSLQHQDYPGPYEIVVVDNNSTDETARVAAERGVRVLHERRPGVCAARQTGSLAAVGEIIVSADADTRYPPGWLSAVDRTLTSSAEIVAVAGPCRYENAPWWTRIFPTGLFGLVAGLSAVTGVVLYASATNIAMRRTAFPGYDLTLTQGGDELDLLRRLRQQGRVEWDQHNAVITSPRRFDRGLLYNLFVSLLVYYLLAYALNRITGRVVLGTAPAFRSDRPPTRPEVRARWLVGVAALALVGSAALVVGAGPAATREITSFLVRP